MSKLTLKQQTFADEYIISGNVEQSAIKAGYSKTYSRSQSYKILANVDVSEYVAKRLDEINSKRIMDQTEVMERLTSIARGEVKKGVYNQTVRNGNKEPLILKKEYEIVPDVEEQTKALELIGKRYSLFTDKVSIDGDMSLKVVIDYGE